MSYIQLKEDNSFLKRVESGNVLWDANNFCTAAALVKDGKAAQFRVVEMVDTPAPLYDPVTQNVARVDPIPIDGVWTEQWAVTAATAEQIAERTEQQRDRKKAQVISEYDTRLYAGIILGGLPIKASDRNIINAIGANRHPKASRQLVVSGQPVTLPDTQIIALEAAIADYTDKLNLRSYNLFTAINAAQSAAELTAIDATTDWPSNTY
jgi:hypothetical protein